MAEISDIKPTCPSCRKRKSVGRNFAAQNVSVRDVTPTTLGTLADRNTNRMSEDEQAHLTHEHTKHRYKPYTGPLPEGAMIMERDSKGDRVVSKKQHKRDPRRRCK